MGLYLYSSENSFQKAFQQLLLAPLLSKKFFQQTVFDIASDLLKEPNGLEKIYRYAHLFDSSGLFIGKPWEDVKKLNPTLVRGTLQAGGTTGVAEILSELRILAIARGEYIHPEMTAGEATEFLTKVLALNIDLLIMKETEENRVKQLYKDEQASEILRFISEHCFSERVFENLYQEVDNLAVQRPIVTEKILKLIASAKKLAGGLEETDSKLTRYEKAVYSPTTMATSTIESYENKLKTCDDNALVKEAHQLKSSMLQTGLVSPYHVVFLKFAANEKQHLLENLLTIDNKSRDNLKSNLPIILSLISTSVTIDTRRSIYGLLCLLQRDIFTNEFVYELEQLMTSPIHEDILVRTNKLQEIRGNDYLKSLIVSEMVNILGTPLGIGQGFNPTCQSTRAISYWSQKEPVMLLNMMNKFLKTGNFSIDFEGKTISSNALSLIPLEDEDHIDFISYLVVPHLDAIYFEMLKAADGRGQDPHKWINPAFHMTGIWSGFSDIYSDLNFLDNFYYYYHPTNNPSVNKGLPQPVGITIYNRSGQVLGAHAILIQRVENDPKGVTRVYFYNPNNDSLQIWGKSIRTSVTGNGELPGESSLPFEDFVQFIYAFHFPQ
ncbi:hypothetical protein SAMN05880501_105115 [Ureibacillus xyleni]|uniref:Uncharacterized protein n=1 Tax=Ureibacillus xyleni TaxID=614648 RepID=A0A285SL46_9BACL|nr:hypothetical protein [Ureibacillus xyleni]SOC08624.1 hypothetical protein SAMN05880501_105115 [Ureibacillus xyleni]